MKYCLAVLFILLTFGPLATIASADSGGASKALIGPHLGIQKSQDSDKANYLVGATLRLKLMPALAAEGSIAYRDEKYGDEAITVRSWPVTVTGLLYPLPIIYGGLGAGWYNTTFDYSDALNNAGFNDETTQEFGWHLAVGIELPLSGKTRVFGDVRYVFLNYDIEDLPDAVIDGVDANFYSISVGLLLGL
ncbi:MAG: outer membrane beta-barrel protein [bacterium]